MNTRVFTWVDAKTLPPQDFDYPDETKDVSVRVVVDWKWAKYNSIFPEPYRFARYQWPSRPGEVGYWMIEGISGSTIINKWIYLV
jgi:hypothetical protein